MNIKHFAIIPSIKTFVWLLVSLLLQLTAKESKQVAEDKAKLTEHFIVTLPQLLLKVKY